LLEYRNLRGKTLDQNKFTRSDGWLLFTLSRKYQNLRTIISAGDHYNHAIFTYEELNQGLLRLLQNGYAEQSDKKFRINDKGKELIKNHLLSDSISDMIRLSDIIVSMVSGIEVDYSKPVISVIEYDIAIKGYMR